MRRFQARCHVGLHIFQYQLSACQWQRAISRARFQNMIFRLLATPFVYKIIQGVLAPGRKALLSSRLRSLPEVLIPAEEILDIGCGPYSAFSQERPYPVGCDFSEVHIASYVGKSGLGVVGSADHLPFDSSSFKTVICVGLFHHLDDEVVRLSISEMLRICEPGGSVVVVDGVLPKKPWYRPFAFFVRKLDRGRFMRYQQKLVGLLTDMQVGWKFERMTTTYTGLEAVICRLEIPMGEV